MSPERLDESDVETLVHTDEQLARHAASGDLNAFEQLVRRRRRTIVRFLYGFTKSTTDAEDICQEAFLRAYRKLDRYDPGKPFMPWLYVIARRLALNHLRKLNRKGETELNADYASREENDLRNDLGAIWHSAKSLLSPDSFAAIHLHYGEDMPIKEIAQALGKTVTATKVILYRARKKLAEKIDFETLEPKA